MAASSRYCRSRFRIVRTDTPKASAARLRFPPTRSSVLRISRRSTSERVPTAGGAFRDLSVEENMAFVASTYRVAGWRARSSVLLQRAGLDGGRALLDQRKRSLAATGAPLAELTGVRRMTVARFEELAAAAGLRTLMLDLRTPGRLLDRVARRGPLRETAVTRVTAVLAAAEDGR